MVHFLFLHPISIHALLAESDRDRRIFMPKLRYFYPRSPCGERHNAHMCGTPRRAISIHALLAESDPGHSDGCIGSLTFLSTLSLRRATLGSLNGWRIKGFLSTLSLRRATAPLADRAQADAAISIHALLAESDTRPNRPQRTPRHFYPRSPCGERPPLADGAEPHATISIHALLAESDGNCLASSSGCAIFLSTLSLRRATWGADLVCADRDISIHALLAESDRGAPEPLRPNPNFYPRSPCGERPY